MPISATAQAVLDGAFTDLLGKVRQRPEEQRLPEIRESTINIMFSGGGAVLPAAGLAGVVEIPYPCRIIWAHMFAGDEQLQAVSVTASVGVWYGSIASWPIGAPLWGSSQPSLAGSSANIDISTWTQNLVTGDILYYVITSFVGTATWMSLNMGIRSTVGEEGSADIVDISGDQVIDSSGNIVRFRV